MNRYHKKRVVYYPAFPGGRHGGSKRSCQIKEFLEADTEIVEQLSLKKTLWASLSSLLRLPMTFVALRKFRLSFVGLLKISSIESRVRDYSIESTEFAIETDRNNGLLLALVALRRGFKTTLYPHNIEFMVPSQEPGAAFSNMASLQAVEIHCYRSAFQVMAISRFDQAILDCFGATSQLFRFQPPLEDLKRLGQIRRKRRARTRSGLLLSLGSVINRPTYIAFESYLPSIAKAVPSGNTLKVAGFGTERCSVFLSSEVELLGAVSDSELDRLLEAADVVILPAIQTTGFITRLAELQVAGVPCVVVGRYLDADLLDGVNVIDPNSNLKESLESLLSSLSMESIDA